MRGRIPRTLSLLAVLAALALAGWACDETSPVSSGAFLEHEEASDFVVDEDTGGKADAFPSSFNPNLILSDRFFRASGLLNGDGLQAFLESTPYGDRSWLADERVGDRRVADAIAQVAVDYDLNPLMLLARMQVEKSLISRSESPSRHAIDFAFGCGCYDNQDCNEAYRGLDNQLACAATTLDNLFTMSVEGSGAWRVERTRTTLDGIAVTPANHATASLYGYTPWTLRGEGGNWLVWNVTRKFALHLQKLELIDLASAEYDDPWIGHPCVEHDDCLFRSQGIDGFCLIFTPYGDDEPAGICSYPCEGYCPDRAGEPWTFCVSDDGNNGFCAAYADEANDYCEDIPGTVSAEIPRFVGASGATAKTAEVCMPR
jgi:hypothetical protein